MATLEEEIFPWEDPSEASPIIAFLNKKKLKLDYILNTHHHFDHIGGNNDLKKLYNAQMINVIGDEIVTYRSKKYSDNEFFFDYGKKEIKSNRKMGHLTIIQK